MWGSRDSRKKVATWLVYKDPQVVSSNTKTLCKTQPRKTHPTRRHNNNPLSLVVFFFGEASITHTHTHILDILRLIKNAIAGQPTHELGGGLTKAARGLNRAQCAEKCQMNETCDYRETITDP